MINPTRYQQVLNDPLIKRWTTRLNHEKNRKQASRVFCRWLEYMDNADPRFSGKTPTELIEYQDTLTGRDRFQLVDQLQDWLNIVSNGKRYNTVKKYRSFIRSFFIHSRCELPRDASSNINSTVPPVQGNLSVDEIKRITDISTPVYKAIYLAMVSGGMDWNAINHWNRHGLDETWDQLRKRKTPLRISLPGRKQNRNKKPYFTFISENACDALASWLKTRPDQGDHIFYSRTGTPMNYDACGNYWRRQLKRLNLITPNKTPGLEPGAIRYGKNLHEMRDVFRTRWHHSKADALVAEFLMGHVVDPLGYNKAMMDENFVRAEYRIAEPWLNIISEDPTKINLSDVDDLRLKVEQQAHQLDELSKAFNSKSTRRNAFRGMSNSFMKEG